MRATHRAEDLRDIDVANGGMTHDAADDVWLASITGGPRVAVAHLSNGAHRRAS
jgi:hypothetical protein